MTLNPNVSEPPYMDISRRAAPVDIGGATYEPLVLVLDESGKSFKTKTKRSNQSTSSR